MKEFESFEDMGRRGIYWHKFRYRCSVLLSILLFISVFCFENNKIAALFAFLWMLSIFLAIYLNNIKELKDQELRNMDWNKKWRERKKK